MTKLISQINENTSLPFKIVAPIVTTLIAGVIWLQSTLSEIQSALKESWTERRMQVWRDRLSDNNPSLKVPTVADITEAKKKD